MRVISKLEKEIINRICEGYSHIGTLLTDHIENLVIEIDREKNHAFLIFHKKRLKKSVNEMASLQFKNIVYIIKFLEYLEYEGYVVSGFFSHSRTLQGKIGIQENIEFFEEEISETIKCDFTDERIKQVFFDYYNKTIFPTHQLIHFQKRKFKTGEDIRHRQIVLISGIAIFISFLLGLWGIFKPVNNSQLSKQQIEQIISEIPKDTPTKQQIDTLISEIRNNAESNNNNE